MKQLFDIANVKIDEKQLAMFEIFYDYLVAENEKYNLTAITEKTDVYVKHFIDSVLIQNLSFDFSNKKMIDIGTGAGFPLIPLKIMNPNLYITGLDSLNKRVSFIKSVCEQLDLTGVGLIHGRAEDFGQDKKYREQYDFAVSRAVAELRLLLEFVMPFVKVDGYFLAYKSIKTKTELEEASNALIQMKSKLIDTVEFMLPNDYGKREIMVIQKYGHIDKKYPRKAGVPKKSPL